MKNKWRFLALTMAVVLCMTAFSVTAYDRFDNGRPDHGNPNCNYTAGEYEYR